jgi:hypothetical protein
MAEMNDLDDTEQECFRTHVLRALDAATAEAFRIYGGAEPGAGATDVELPALFDAVDAHAKRVLTRLLKNAKH